MLLSRKTVIAVAISFVATLFAAEGASASTRWAATHSARAEVNHRLAHLNHRIHREARMGLISHAEAHRLHRELRFVRHEERFMAAQHNGHITRAEKRALNQQENGVARKLVQ